MRILIAGFGNVGKTVAAQLGSASKNLGFDIELVGVSDPRFGVVIDGAGIDGEALAVAVAEVGTFADHPGHRQDLDTLGMITAADADVLVELTFTDLHTGQPAQSHIEAAIAAGMHVSTTNKGPIALHLSSLEDACARTGVTLAYEGTVMSGTPAVAIARDTIRTAGFRSAIGILNGTTNFMIGRMEAGLGFDESLAEAQELGYAEADPTGDIEGHDAAAKLVILARVLTGAEIPVDEVATGPLTEVDADTIRAARAEGAAWKYVATLDPDDPVRPASVGLRRLPGDHPLAFVGGATNALTFDTELLGSVTIAGAGAGRTETAAAVLSDLVQIRRSS